MAVDAYRPECKEKAVQELKNAFRNTADLAYPNYGAEFILHLDASDHAIGATLSQEDPEVTCDCYFVAAGN